MATEPPVRPKETAMEAALVVASMDEVSVAFTVMSPATRIPSPMVPSMNALTVAAMVLVVLTPVPARATPIRPPAMATDPASTLASMVWSASAVTVRSSAASTLESFR